VRRHEISDDCLFIAILALSAPALAADKVKLSYVLSSVEYADLFLAIDKGYFAQEGIEPELQQAGGGVAVPALIAGSLDFSTSGSVAISAILKGAKLKVLFVSMRIRRCRSGRSRRSRALPISRASRSRSSAAATRPRSRSAITRQARVAGRLRLLHALGTGLARFAAIAAGTYPAALVNASEIEDMRATGKLGNLHRLVDLRQEITMTTTRSRPRTRSSRRTRSRAPHGCARS